MTVSPPTHRNPEGVVRRILYRIRQAAAIVLITLYISLLTALIECGFDPLSGVSYRGFPLCIVIINPPGSGEPRLQISPVVFGINSVLWLGPVMVFRAALADRAFQTKHQRRREGRCVNCGYDLTGNTSGVCPECGRSAEDKY